MRSHYCPNLQKQGSKRHLLWPKSRRLRHFLSLPGSSFVFTVLNMPEIATAETGHPGHRLIPILSRFKTKSCTRCEAKSHFKHFKSGRAILLCSILWSIVLFSLRTHVVLLCVLIQLIYSDFSQRLR